MKIEMKVESGSRCFLVTIVRDTFTEDREDRQTNCVQLMSEYLFMVHTQMHLT